VISITLNKKDLVRIKAALSSLRVKDKNGVFMKAMTKATLEVEGQLKTAVSGDRLKVRSGRLRSSIGSIVTESGDSIIGMIGSGVRQGDRVKYANIQETGGVITPKRGKYLTIPLPAALTPAGVLRKPARQWPDTFVMKSNNGNLLIMQKKGKRVTRLVALFVLKKQVTIPASRYMSDVAERMQDKVIDIILNGIRQEVEKK
jgi:hypothetical protein